MESVWYARVPISPDLPAQRLDIWDLPMGADCFLQLDASGEIWSGVVFTGNTPPAGWDMLTAIRVPSWAARNERRRRDDLKREKRQMVAA